MSQSNDSFAENPITENAITLIEAQNQLANWRNKMKDILGIPLQEVPTSIFISLNDLHQITQGLQKYSPGHNVMGARLYFCFDGDGYGIKGLLVPVGYKKDPAQGPISTNDIVLNIQNSENIQELAAQTTPIDPDALVTVYDFTLPCPPYCNGQSTYLQS